MCVCLCVYIYVLYNMLLRRHKVYTTIPNKITPICSSLTMNICSEMY